MALEVRTFSCEGCSKVLYAQRFAGFGTAGIEFVPEAIDYTYRIRCPRCGSRYVFHWDAGAGTIPTVTKRIMPYTPLPRCPSCGAIEGEPCRSIGVDKKPYRVPHKKRLAIMRAREESAL